MTTKTMSICSSLLCQLYFLDDIAHHVPTCLNKKCYHGAECMIRDGLAECVCPNFCSHSTSATMICGSDSRTYGSECQLKQYACRHQKEIYVSYEGACGVVTPASATTLPPSGRARKTTRHLAPKDRDYQTPNLVNPTVSSTEFGEISTKSHNHKMNDWFHIFTSLFGNNSSKLTDFLFALIWQIFHMKLNASQFTDIGLTFLVTLLKMLQSDWLMKC